MCVVSKEQGFYINKKHMQETYFEFRKNMAENKV